MINDPRKIAEWLESLASSPMSLNPEHQDLCNNLAAAGLTMQHLVSLVRHCWVHSGYRNCGRSQMGSQLGPLYDLLIASAVDP